MENSFLCTDAGEAKEQGNLLYLESCFAARISVNETNRREGEINQVFVLWLLVPFFSSASLFFLLCPEKKEAL